MEYLLDMVGRIRIFYSYGHLVDCLSANIRLEKKGNMKTKEAFRIVFMGTPDFAVTQLKSIVEDGLNVVGVVTTADKPAGRGQQVQESAVKQAAVEYGLNILQPTNLKDPEFQAELAKLNADLFVVVAFRMLPESVWSMPPMGTINLHASILPQYRGAAPINRAIMNGETQTGVTTFFIEKEIDTGKIIDRTYVTIEANETVGELHDRLMHIGATTMLETIHKIRSGNATGIDQVEFQEGKLKSAPKIFKGDCQINWSQPAETVHNFIRGLDPYPAAWGKWMLNNMESSKTFKVFGSEITDQPSNASNKKLLAEKNALLFPTSDFYLRIKEIQPEGKRRMSAAEFLAGNALESIKLVD